MLRASFCCCAFSLRSSSIAVLIYFAIFQCCIIGCVFAFPAEIPFTVQMISLSWSVFAIFWILVAVYGIDQRKPKCLIPHILVQIVQLLLLAMFIGYAIGVYRDLFSIYVDIAVLSMLLLGLTLNGYFITVLCSYKKIMIEQ